MINLYSIELALTPNPVLFSLWATKFLSNFCAIYKVLYWWNLKEDPTFPCSKQEGVIKYNYNVLMSPAPHISKSLTVGVYTVVEWIESTSTAAITKVKFHFLSIGHTSTTETLPIILIEGDRTGAAFQEQVDIGWQHTLEGKLSV